MLNLPKKTKQKQKKREEITRDSIEEKKERGMKSNGRKREAREDTISEVGRQTTVPDHSPAGKSEIATRDEGWLRDAGRSVNGWGEGHG